MGNWGLVAVLMSLGIFGTVIFVPWTIYREKKKISLKYQRIGCLVSAAVLIVGMYLMTHSVYEDSSSFNTIPKETGSEATEKNSPIIPEIEIDSQHKTLEAKINLSPASSISGTSAIIILNTNLPNHTSVIAVLSDANTYRKGLRGYADSKGTVLFLRGFENEDAFSGTWYLDVATEKASDQNTEVRETIGDYGQYLVGDNIVVGDDGNRYVRVRFEIEALKNEESEYTDVSSSFDSVTEAEINQNQGDCVAQINQSVILSTLEKEIPQSYKNSRQYFTDVYVNTDNSVDIMLQLEQNSDSTDAALTLATEYYVIAKRIVEEAGGRMGLYDMMVLNGSSPVGDYLTRDGEEFTVISNGIITKITIP